MTSALMNPVSKSVWIPPAAFGALEPRLPEVLRTPSGRIELGAPEFLCDLDRLAAAIPELDDRELVLVGRRHLRSNNSWMHNYRRLVKGREMRLTRL